MFSRGERLQNDFEDCFTFIDYMEPRLVPQDYGKTALCDCEMLKGVGEDCFPFYADSRFFWFARGRHVLAEVTRTMHVS